MRAVEVLINGKITRRSVVNLVPLEISNFSDQIRWGECDTVPTDLEDGARFHKLSHDDTQMKCAVEHVSSSEETIPCVDEAEQGQLQYGRHLRQRKIPAKYRC